MPKPKSLSSLAGSSRWRCMRQSRTAIKTSRLNVKMMARCIELDRDCADICSLAVQFMARGSKYAEKLCALCAEICKACGDECAKSKLEHCQRCAEACHKFADECNKMGKA